MNRPTVLQIGGTLYWTLQTRNPDTGVLKDADSTPTVAVRKNGSSTGDSVTVTKRSATTGLYDCSYNPAGEVEGDSFTLEESATVTGTTTSSASYANSFSVRVVLATADVHSGTILTGTADTGSTDTSIAIKSITPTLSATDQLKGRVILFRTDTATATLRGQGAPIDGNTTTAITLASSDALTTAPAENDTFTIV
jgi:hypothetical protein